MHIEKNVYENIIGTILNVDGKSKDNLQSRLDLVDMGIRLYPQVLPNGKYRLPPLIFVMSKEEREVFCMVLKDIKAPDTFLSKLKSYYCNKRYLEGSIVKGYLVEECMTFCSRYLEDVETRLSRPSRNARLNYPNLAKTYLFQSYGESIGKVEIAELNEKSWVQAHRYVLFHHDSIEPLRNARDSNPVEGYIEYYGFLTDIIELDYYGRWKVVLFQCDWADVNTEKLKEKKAEYEVIASTDTSINLKDIDNRIIIEVLGPKRYGRVRFQGSGVTLTQYFESSSQQYMSSGSQPQAEVQRLRDRIAQMQASTVEQITEVQRKYEEL
ncbi:hypothetical protein J1N35_002496 [Gossypium stocksii]|uniref:DUF4218 domain-containing protein n=1 Tax=Gossypium stocksii TaxID=47602 RepID=A0A9D4ANK2_9ROSI|nr:hypothetical protein J1N35_002496 [Gossypium stocksii]